MTELAPKVPSLRVIFASYHASFDPSNGAARTMRDVLHVLAQDGVGTASLSGPCVDTLAESPRVVVRGMLAAQGSQSLERELPGGASLVAVRDRRTPSFCYLPSAPNGPEPAPAQAEQFLDLLRQMLSAHKPHVVLTYGGGQITRSILRACKEAGARTVVRIMNLRYGRRDLFDAVDGVLVPAPWVVAHYARTLKLDTHCIPCPLDWDRTVVPHQGAQFLTYVAPCQDKGLPWAARVLSEVEKARPDIPVLVVEGRGDLDAFARALPPGAGRSFQCSKTVADPRSFLRQTRVLFMPSYVEPSGRLAQEAIINGTPVVASDRGGLPWTVGDAGTCLPIDVEFSGMNDALPSVRMVRPWVEAIARAWDEGPGREALLQHGRLRRVEWEPAQLAARYRAYLEDLAGRSVANGSATGPLSDLYASLHDDGTAAQDSAAAEAPWLQVTPRPPPQ